MNGSQNELKINFLALGVASSCPFFVYMGSPYICPQKQNSMAIENGLMRFIAEMCVWKMPLRAYIEGGLRICQEKHRDVCREDASWAVCQDLSAHMSRRQLPCHYSMQYKQVTQRLNFKRNAESAL